ncbi:putative anti-sigma factor [Gordonia polyisoprenivorans NBRC 16320 = JCM 10675]|uniref:anti-sigma factor n=1 Tax=Gordonia polyisoprenivorans TaxID=84595 RepID=UPI00023A9007|nr:anti-sigma factor [Gordonia polyisoprenivorans]UZF56054.1 anti-sigma factor [Gordonia polyisoprenivorans]WCB37108.1 anti-sigma factor [Gordonia polyisoprenivorans]GAB23341.1 putative anti-sigma factor [Gordonia polyisoprenivorans NBRC 16320 = JCM 10675]
MTDSGVSGGGGQTVIVDLLDASGEPVELAVGAESDRLSIIRSVVERTLYLADWTVDEVTDVKIAIDEICSQLISAAVAGARVHLSLTVGPTGAVARAASPVIPGFEIDTTGFGWRVVTTLTDAHTIECVDRPDHRDLTVTIGKTRQR